MLVRNDGINEYSQELTTFISELEGKGIKILVDSEGLRCKAPRGVLTQEIARCIQERKEEIINYLQAEANKNIFFAPIEQVGESQYYPLSAAQKRMYVMNEVDRESTAYNLPQILKIEGEFDRKRFSDVVRKLIDRHEALRTSFEVIEGSLIQKVHKSAEFRLDYQEIDGTVESIDSVIEEFVRPYDLSRLPLFRYKLVRVKSDDCQIHYLLQDMHHIISDGLSLAILIKEINALYAGKSLPALKLQYKDYAVWNEKLLSGDIGQAQKRFWTEQLKGELPILNLPADYTRPSRFSYKGESISFGIVRGLADKLNILARENKVTLFTVLLAAYNVLLSRYSGQKDIIVGSPAAGRRHADVYNVVGVFVNTLVYRNFPESDKPFDVFLKETGKNVLQVLGNQDYPFEAVIQDLSIERDPGRNPVFDTMFALQNMNFEDVSAAGITITQYEYKACSAQFDLSVDAKESKNGIEFEINYCTDLFKRSTVEKLGRHYIRILEEIIENPHTHINKIEMLTDEEKKQLLTDFNNTAVECPINKTLQELFEEQVKRTPENIAVVFKNEKLTYNELNQKANCLARILREKGVKQDAVVALMLERSIEMLVGILGVLKAGGAYLPIDPVYPQERIKTILGDSGAGILLTCGDLASGVEFQGAVLDLKEKTLYTGEADNPDKINSSSDLAYIIYTSGTTGLPKGAMVEHRNVIAYINAFQKEFGLDSSDAVLQQASFSFDTFVEEMYPVLLNGGRLVIADRMEVMDMQAMAAIIVRNGVSLISCSPLLLNEINKLPLEALKGVHTFISGGDVLKYEYISNLVKNSKVYNTYGPTEATVCATYHKCSTDEQGRNIPIGKPISNYKIFVVDSCLNLLPAGVPGELCIAGQGVVRGYLNRPELTSEKFVEAPFVPGMKMYRTGDLARWLPDGSIEYLGRIDHQVKIRGYRIELGEIESRLLKYEGISEAAVLAWENENGSKYLCAYIVSDKELTVVELREHLAGELPEYMFPSCYIRLDSMPVTTNGKLDKKALPEPDREPTTGEEYQAPEDEIQKKLVEIWQDVLSRGKVGVNDNFFELGGDSIKAIQVSSRLNNYGLKLELKDLFQYKNIKELSAHVKVSKRTVSQETVEGKVEFTPIQKWFFDSGFSVPGHYNQAVMLKGKNGFDAEALRKVFNRILAHHDALRMVYTTGDEGARQLNRGIEGELFVLEAFDFRDMKDYAARAEAEATRIQGSFELEKGPLVKLGLFKTSQGDHLLIVIHHLVVDGVSWRIILEDLNEGYLKTLENKEFSLPKKTDSYKVWSESLRAYANSRELLKEIDYWRELEKTRVYPLLRDNISDSDRNEDSSILSAAFSEEETSKLLNGVNHAYNTEINDILLTALGMALKGWMGMESALINLEGHGREEIAGDVDITRTVGWFTSMYPVVLDMSRSEDISYQIKKVKEDLRRIPAKGVGYGILKYLTASENKKDLEFLLEPEISFNYLGQFDNSLDTEIFGISSFSSGKGISLEMERQCALDINCIVKDRKLELVIDYNRHEYYEDSMIKLLSLFKQSLTNIIDHCTGKQWAELTPTDLGNSELSIEELEGIEDLFGDL